MYYPKGSKMDSFILYKLSNSLSFQCRSNNFDHTADICNQCYLEELCIHHRINFCKQNSYRMEVNSWYHKYCNSQLYFYNFSMEISMASTVLFERPHKFQNDNQVYTKFHQEMEVCQFSYRLNNSFHLWASMSSMLNHILSKYLECHCKMSHRDINHNTNLGIGCFHLLMNCSLCKNQVKKAQSPTDKSHKDWNIYIQLKDYYLFDLLSSYPKKIPLRSMSQIWLGMLC